MNGEVYIMFLVNLFLARNRLLHVPSVRSGKVGFCIRVIIWKVMSIEDEK